MTPKKIVSQAPQGPTVKKVAQTFEFFGRKFTAGEILPAGAIEADDMANLIQAGLVSEESEEGDTQ